MTELTAIPPHSLIIRSKENAQSQEEDDNSHQAFKNVEGTEDHTERLLSIPLETPLQIFIYPFHANTDQICPHARF